MTVEFIDAHREEFGVEPICKALQVAPSTYSLGANGVEVEMRVTAGPLVGDRLVAIIDKNGDGAFTEAETTAYGEAIAAEVAIEVAIEVDGRSRPLVLISITVPPTVTIRAGAGELILTALAAGAPVKRKLQFVDNRRVMKGQAQLSLLDTGRLPPDLVIDR